MRRLCRIERTAGDYLVTICSAVLEDTHILYVTAALLNEVHPTVGELPGLFDQLQLSRLLREHGSIVSMCRHNPHQETCSR